MLPFTPMNAAIVLGLMLLGGAGSGSALFEFSEGRGPHWLGFAVASFGVSLGALAWCMFGGLRHQ